MGTRRGLGERMIRLLGTGMVVAALLAAGPAAASPRHGTARDGTSPVSLGRASRSALPGLFASFLGVPRSDIAGIRPGSLHAAYQPAARTEWATARFLPAATAPPGVLLRFQDGASTAVFTRASGHGWRIARVGGEPLVCPGALPTGVGRAFGLSATAACPAQAAAPAKAPVPALAPLWPTAASRRGHHLHRLQAASATSIVQAALANVGVGDRPASTNFGFNCNPYTSLLAVGASHHHCRRNLQYAVKNQNQLWCANFAKWVWEQGGVTADLATLTPAAASFYGWGQQQGEIMPADKGVPAPGDAVVFYPAGQGPDASYADHVGIVTAVNPDGTVNLVNGDFAGPTNISVQETDEVLLGPWASAMWGQGESWVFVSPLGQVTPPPP